MNLICLARLDGLLIEPVPKPADHSDIADDPIGTERRAEDDDTLNAIAPGFLRPFRTRFIGDDRPAISPAPSNPFTHALSRVISDASPFSSAITTACSPGSRRCFHRPEAEGRGDLQAGIERRQLRLLRRWWRFEGNRKRYRYGLRTQRKLLRHRLRRP